MVAFVNFLINERWWWWWWWWWLHRTNTWRQKHVIVRTWDFRFGAQRSGRFETLLWDMIQDLICVKDSILQSHTQIW